MAEGQTPLPITAGQLRSLLRPNTQPGGEATGAMAIGGFAPGGDATPRDTQAGPTFVVLALSLMAVVMAAAAMSCVGILVIAVWHLARAIPVPAFVLHMVQALHSWL